MTNYFRDSLQRKMMCAASAFFCTLFIFGAIASGERPNVVLILADDLGYGDLSCYGQQSYRTPAIDRLAAEGIKATDFYVPVPYCAPSRAALLTGRFPLRNGVTRNPHPDTTPEADVVGLDPSERTLGEAFQQAGYRTACIGKWHLGHKEHFYPTRHGFDSYYGILYSNDMLPVQILEDEKVVENPVDQRTLTTKYTQKAIEFINTSEDQPFFLYFPHAMPHKPLAVSDKYDTPDTPDEGAKFNSFYVSPVCSPTRAALMTGSHSTRVGIGGVMFPRNNHGLNPDEITLPELLKDQGYATAIKSKKVDVETLYNLRDDIGEQTNLIDVHPEIAQRLKRQLSTFETDLRKNLRPAGVAQE